MASGISLNHLYGENVTLLTLLFIDSSFYSLCYKISPLNNTTGTKLLPWAISNRINDL